MTDELKIGSIDLGPADPRQDTPTEQRMADAALRPTAPVPPNRLEIRANDDGTLDEIVATGAYIHLEQMAANVWLLIVEADGREVHVSLYTDTKERAPIRAQANDWPAKRVKELGDLA